MKERRYASVAGRSQMEYVAVVDGHMPLETRLVSVI